MNLQIVGGQTFFQKEILPTQKAAIFNSAHGPAWLDLLELSLIKSCCKTLSVI